MTSINGDFIDAHYIKIVNDVPCYFYSGNTYLEKLKNGISLDYIFMLEDSLIKPNEIVEQIIEKPKPNTPCKSIMFIEEYDYDILPMQRKGKKINKKPAGKNMKKNKIKQNGYNDKVSFIETHLPPICELNNCYYDSDYDYEYEYGYNYDSDYNYDTDYSIC